MRCRPACLFVITIAMLSGVSTAFAEELAKLPPQAAYALSDFGAIDNPKQAQAAFDRAIEQLRQTGGILLVPGGVWKQLASSAPLQGLLRTPAPPEETKRWQTGPGVTVVTSDDKQAIVRVPPLVRAADRAAAGPGRRRQPAALGHASRCSPWTTSRSTARPAISIGCSAGRRRARTGGSTWPRSAACIRASSSTSTAAAATAAA